jgi:hypothetical protein
MARSDWHRDKATPARELPLPGDKRHFASEYFDVVFEVRDLVLLRHTVSRHPSLTEAGREREGTTSTSTLWRKLYRR